MKHVVIDARVRRSSTGRYTDRLVEHLQTIDRTNRYTILVQPDDTWQMHNPHFSTLACPFAQFSFNPLDQIRFAWQLYRLKPNLVHFTMTQQPLLYFGQVVTTTHDLTMFQFVRRGTTPLPLYNIKIALYKFLVWWSHLKSRTIITPTHFVADEIARFQPGIKGKLAVTYEASEPPLAVDAARPTQINDSDQFIMYVGTAFPHKNLPRLIDAFNRLASTHSQLKLVLVGKHEKHYEDLKRYIATHAVAPERVILTGFISDESLKWLYEHTQAYVFVSLSEGFGLPPLEAMQHGAPVVSSDASCMPEVYGDAAHYFDATDPDDIAAKVQDVLSTPELRSSLIAQGYKQVKKYSWKKMAHQTLAIYHTLLKT